MIEKKIYDDINGLKQKIDSLRSIGEKIVFTNGCFDLLHKGHVLYLEEAKKLGDFLIIGLNSDQSITRLKGPDRPIKKIMDRVFVLAALESVDAVIVFEEDTPLNLVSHLIPDVLVKGGDWKVEDIVGSDIVIANGGLVKSLSYIKSHSTSSIIENSKLNT